MGWRSPVNVGAPWPTPREAAARVQRNQAKLHRWATDDPRRRFDDLYNLVCDPATLLSAWRRVRANRGARSAGVDGETVRSIVERGEGIFLAELRAALGARTFRPVPVRERMIPKTGGKRRRLGIPTVRDRVVQAALKLVLEPIFEADFAPCSYGFRPNRRAQDAIAEVHFFGSHSYEWVLEGDISACFDEIDHRALMGRVRRRIGDRRVLSLVKAFLRSGILSEDGIERETVAGTPQGGILSPLLANIALSVLDEFFVERWTASGPSHARERRRRQGLANCRLVRYADDFVVLVAGTCAHAEHLRDEVATVLRPMGLRLSAEKTRVVHIDEGLDFLGFRIQRHQERGARRQRLHTYPSKTALAAVKARVRTLTQQAIDRPLSALLHRLRPVLRGWTAYFRHGVSKPTFSYLRAFVWRRVVSWLRRKHARSTWTELRRRYLPGWWPTEGEARLFDPATVTVSRYRYRGDRIPSPWLGSVG